MLGKGTFSAGDDGTASAGPANGAGGRRIRRYLSELKAGDRADEIFVINNVQLGTKKNGEPFLKMLVSDRSARVATKWWDKGQAMLEKLPDPGIVRIRGRMEDFNGSPQFVVDQILQVRDSSAIDFTELLPCTSGDVQQMFADLSGILRGLRSPILRALAEAYLADEKLMADFRRAPAAMTFHHAYLGGLLEHTLNAMRAAAALADLYPRLNRDLVVFGIFVHDLAKTWELIYDTCFDYTDGGRLVGHIVKSAMWLEEKATSAAAATGREIPREVIDLLEHIVLSHHGELSHGFGSARSPMTPEAWAVHLIENLDAKLTMALCACREGQDNARWTDHHKALGGKLFRPDILAEADLAWSGRPARAATSAGAEQEPPTAMQPAESAGTMLARCPESRAEETDGGRDAGVDGPARERPPEDLPSLSNPLFET